MAENRWARLDDGAGRVVFLDVAGGSDRVLTADRDELIGDGTFTARTLRSGRKLTLGGLAHCPDQAQTEQFERMLSGLFLSDTIGTGTKGTLVHDNGTGPLTAEGVEPDGPPRIETDFRFGRVRFEIPLFAPDPYLRAEPQLSTTSPAGLDAGLEWPLFDNGAGVTTGFLEWSVGSSQVAVPVTNHGNAVAYPVVVVSGNFPSGVSVALSTGARVTYRGTIWPASPATIDFGGSLSIGGVDQSWAVTDPVWGGVAPGGVVSFSVEPVSGGAGSAVLELRSTYL